jgi:hypothetical protein
MWYLVNRIEFDDHRQRLHQMFLERCNGLCLQQQQGPRTLLEPHYMRTTEISTPQDDAKALHAVTHGGFTLPSMTNTMVVLTFGERGYDRDKGHEDGR